VNHVFKQSLRSSLPLCLASWFGVVLYLGALAVSAQTNLTNTSGDEATKATNKASAAQLRVEERFERVRGLLESIRLYEGQIDAAREARDSAGDEPTKQEFVRQISYLISERNNLTQTLEELAVGAEVDRALFHHAEKEPFDLRSELERLIEPVVRELKETTAETRIIKEKESELVVIRDRLRAAELAVDNLQSLLAADPPDDVAAALRSQQAEWQRRLSAARSQSRSLGLQLNEYNAGKKSFLEVTRAYLSNFMRTRGLHLLLGILAFCLVFFGLRALYGIYRRVRPLGEFRSFASRLGALIYHIFTTFAAVGALLLVFNVTGDWFLLTLSIFFLIGVGWVGIKALPRMFEQVKLMLNFGAVRENELLIYQGIPWRVEDIGLTATLVNPRLAGGEQILPIRDLVGLVSRRPAPVERWFPCESGEWIRLQDGTLGQVRVQTPNHVELVRLGGSHVTYPTDQFYKLAPENLSDGFRIDHTFGLDYVHLAEAAEVIPTKMAEALRSGLADIVSETELLDLVVELKGASKSSLDYAVQAVFTGSASDRYEQLERALPRILIQACNQNAWKIPFTQITIHQGG